MINPKDIITFNSRLYYELLQEFGPELLQYASVVSKDKDNPYIEEPGTLI